MAALVGYKVTLVAKSANFPRPASPPYSLGWLPHNLECLETDLWAWETCPCLPGLRILKLQRGLRLPLVRLSTKFPALEVLHLPRALLHVPLGPENDLPVVLKDLPALTNLQEISVSDINGSFVDFSAPPACRIRYSLTLEPRAGAAPPNLNIAILAPHLARNLQSLKVQLYGTDHGVPAFLKLNLGELQDCPLLEEVRIEQGTIGFPFAGNLLVYGFENLPPACKRVVLVPNPRRIQGDCSGLPFVKPTPGWEIVLGAPSVEFFEPMAWRIWLDMGWEPPCPAFVQRVDV